MSLAPKPTRAPLVEDADLVSRIRSGDEAALEQVFRASAMGLTIHAARIVGSRAAAEEVVQDLFLKLWDAREALEVRGSLVAYLYRAVANRALNARRHARSAERIQHAILAASGDEPERAPAAVDDEAERRELAEAIARAIESLPKRGREVFVLNRAHGLTYDEVAVKLNLSVKTVETHMGRALRALRQRLAIFLS